MEVRCVVTVDDINCCVQDCSNDLFSPHTILIKNKTYGTRRYLNLYVCVSTVDPRSPHTALSMYTNERVRTPTNAYVPDLLFKSQNP